MDNFLKSLLELSVDNQKDNYIYNESSRAQGIAGELEIQFEGTSHRYYNQELLTWCCTDTKVGLKAHYFDNKLIAISTQHARKSSESYYWVSEELKLEFEQFLAFDESLEDGLTELWARKGKLERELSYVNKQLFHSDKGFYLIDAEDWKQTILYILKEFCHLTYKHDKPHWDKVKSNFLNI